MRRELAAIVKWRGLGNAVHMINRSRAFAFFACGSFLSACFMGDASDSLGADAAVPTANDAAMNLPDGAPGQDANVPDVCPKSAPFDDSDPRINGCTRSVVVGAGNALRHAVSYDD